jgi:hypothetical protein
VRTARGAPAAILACVALFVALEVPAMLLYPGGTWWDAGTRGHRFWENFLCDLEWRVALDGTPNPVGSRLAEGAMLALAAAFVPFWIAAPRLFAARAPRLARVTRTLGLVGVGGMAAVVLMPSDRFGALHGVAVIVAGVPSLLATGAAEAGFVLGEPKPRVAASIGGALLATALLDFALYVSHLVGRTEGTPLVAAAQKVALLLLLAWMAAIALRSARA